MKITSAFLVVVVAVSVTHGEKQGKFPDLLAPFRGMFGRTTPGPGPTGQPHRAVAQAQTQGPKDLNGAATNKPYGGGPGPSASPAGEDDDGFRPSLFGSGYEPGRGPTAHDSPQNGGGRPQGYPGGRGPQGYPGGRGPPGPHHGRPSHGRPGPGTNRPTRQEAGTGYGFGPFGGLDNGGGRPSASGSSSPFSGGDFGSFGADFGSFDGPSSQGSQSQGGHGGFGGQGHPPASHGPPSYSPQNHGPPTHGPPHHGPPHGHGPHGHGPRPSHAPHHRGPNRYRGGPPGGHHGPQSSPSEYNGPSGHHGGPGGPGGPGSPRPGGHYGGGPGGPRPFHSSRPAPPEYSQSSPGSHYNANEHNSRPSNSPQGFFGPGGSDYPEQFDGGHRETREPQIITADDVSRPGNGGGFVGPSFDDVYSSPQGAPVSFGPPSTNPSFGLGYSPASGAPGNPYGRQLNGFAPQDDSASGLIRSNPLRPSTRPFNGFHSSSEEASSSPYLRQASGGKPFTFSRPLGASYQASNEDIHYGRPMMMSASGGNSRVARVPRAGRRKKIAATNSPHIVQLHSPKDPNFIRPSASTIDAVTSASDLNPAATGHGGDYHHGDDRILYHVAGHQGPYSYRFGYDTGKGSHNRQFRHEEKDGKGYVKGRYGFYDKSGKLNVINYQAHPEHGYHAERGHAHGHY